MTHLESECCFEPANATPLPVPRIFPQDVARTEDRNRSLSVICRSDRRIILRLFHWVMMPMLILILGWDHACRAMVPSFKLPHGELPIARANSGASKPKFQLAHSQSRLPDRHPQRI